MVTKPSRRSLRAREKSGLHNVPGSNQEVSESFGRMSTLPLGHMSKSDPEDYSNISPTKSLLTNVQKAASGLPKQFSAAPPKFYLPRQHHCDFPRVCAQLAGFSFAFVKFPARFKHCSTNSKPMMFMSSASSLSRRGSRSCRLSS